MFSGINTKTQLIHSAVQLNTVICNFFMYVYVCVCVVACMGVYIHKNSNNNNSYSSNTNNVAASEWHQRPDQPYTNRSR